MSDLLRQSALSAVRAIIRRTDVLYIDVETTGLEPDDEIIEIAAVDSNGYVHLNTLVRTDRPMNPRAFAKHHISTEMLVDAPTWPDVHHQLARLCSRFPVIVAYKAEFDNARITRNNQLYHLAPLEFEWCCAMRWYRQFSGPKRRYALKDAVAQFGGDASTHRALADAQACLMVVRSMARLSTCSADEDGTQLPPPSDVRTPVLASDANRVDQQVTKDTRRTSRPTFDNWLITNTDVVGALIDGLFDVAAVSGDQRFDRTAELLMGALIAAEDR